MSTFTEDTASFPSQSAGIDCVQFWEFHPNSELGHLHHTAQAACEPHCGAVCQDGLDCAPVEVTQQFLSWELGLSQLPEEKKRVFGLCSSPRIVRDLLSVGFYVLLREMVEVMHLVDPKTNNSFCNNLFLKGNSEMCSGCFLSYGQTQRAF